MSNFEGTAVRTLDDLVQFNRFHADLELPPGVFVYSSYSPYP